MDREQSTHAPEQVTPLPSSALPCLSCGYDLRGCISEPHGTCPECGSRFDADSIPELAARLEPFIEQATRHAFVGGISLFGLLMIVAIFCAIVACDANVSVAALFVVLGSPFGIVAVVSLLIDCRLLGKLMGYRQGWRGLAFLAALCNTLAIAAMFLGAILLLVAIAMVVTAATIPLDPVQHVVAVLLSFGLGLVFLYVVPPLTLRAGRHMMRRAVLGSNDMLASTISPESTTPPHCLPEPPPTATRMALEP